MVTLASLATLAKIFGSEVNRLIKRKILSHNTPLYLNVYGQAHQKNFNFPSKMPKTRVFW